MENYRGAGLARSGRRLAACSPWARFFAATQNDNEGGPAQPPPDKTKPNEMTAERQGSGSLTLSC